jgi:hypothetical protein
MAERALNEEGALTKLRGRMLGFSITRSIALAAELGIADRLADGPRTPAELARECGVLEHPLAVCGCTSARPGHTASFGELRHND